jgi:hypothetical protein
VLQIGKAKKTYQHPYIASQEGLMEFVSKFVANRNNTNQGSSVDIETRGYGLHNRETGVEFQAGVRIFFSSRFQTGSWADPASCPMDKMAGV